MKRKENTDRHLQAPAEANRDKHINFLKPENDNNSHSSQDKDNGDHAAPGVQKQWDDLKKNDDDNRR